MTATTLYVLYKNKYIIKNTFCDGNGNKRKISLHTIEDLINDVKQLKIFNNCNITLHRFYFSMPFHPDMLLQELISKQIGMTSYDPIILKSQKIKKNNYKMFFLSIQNLKNKFKIT